MKEIVVLLIISITLSCNAQHKKPSDFIPEGYVLYEKHFGDLNNDKQDDYVLIIKGTAKENIVVDNYNRTVDRNRRGIIVLFKIGNSYKLADYNYNCFSSKHEDGGGYYPPQLFIEFEEGNLKILYRHGKYGFWSYMFRYQHANFELIKYEATSSRGPITLKETSIDFVTKQKIVRENTNDDAESDEEVFKETQTHIKIDALIKISDITDFDERPILNSF
ncbi:hypothetical protein [Winogradskyella sp.]|uniref:hypothetical protein n=1 Tax=Winogradskyella sp. TaxID=1883156 RepID=UPI0025D598B4|nr:hypothetical protein [Winogradskyella sp.]MCT4629443.1 hypothetical protein [Winogradskyella sp.]